MPARSRTLSNWSISVITRLPSRIMNSQSSAVPTQNSESQRNIEVSLAFGVLRRDSIRDRPVAPRSPWQNAYVERLIGSIRRECLDHMIVFGEAHLRRILGAYALHRTRSCGPGTPGGSS